MTPAMWHALHATEVVKRVAARLEQGGAIVERHQLARLSFDELTLLIRREAGLA